MRALSNSEPRWAVLIIWAVVNATNLLQTAGFLSRLRSGDLAVNHILGYGIIALALPAAVALGALLRARADALHWVGAAVFLAFVALMVAVEYLGRVEFRSPARYAILVPYLVLFFGGVLLMGLPMFRVDRRLWLVTVATSVLLLASMGAAMRAGVG